MKRATENMGPYIFDLAKIDKSNVTLFGGKAANLGELFRMNGVQVPEGFCICTNTYKEVIGNDPDYNFLLEQLVKLKTDSRKKIIEISESIRTTIESIAMPESVVSEITRRITQLGERGPYAVRSSATAEDLPTASFAGQQDTYLNIIGTDAIINHISKCWASLFTERAIVYRRQNGFDHRNVHLAVIVQRMVFPQAAGIMFTADPFTANRKVLSIDASFGLADALVSGLVNADHYRVQEGRVIEKKISTKKTVIYPLKSGGTEQVALTPDQQNKQSLTNDQALRLARIGREIEKHFGHPQDIEWCLADDVFFVVQTRPITTLFPIPERPDGLWETDESRVYISVGHQQMMTDPIKPLGLSLWQITPMHKAGGRLFVDITNQLSSADSRKALLAAMGRHDPLIKDALCRIIERGDLIKPLPDEGQTQSHVVTSKTIPPRLTLEADPTIVLDLVKSSEKALATLKQEIKSKCGSDLFDFILEDIRNLNKSLFDPKSMGVIMAAIDASIWINENMYLWLGDKNAADTISQSVSNNITSEMGLALLDVADVIRPYPKIVDYLQRVKNDNFLHELAGFDGGQETRDAINGFLIKFGMRCAGEIDITKSRWSEKPSTLLPIILSNIKNTKPGSSKVKFEKGLQEALKKEHELLTRLRHLPDGDQKAKEAKQMIDLVRNFSGYREYPKYGIVNRYFVYKQALLKEAEQLVQAGIIHEREDVYYLTFEEFRAVVCTHKLDYKMIERRKEEYKVYEKLSPPRVITSDGEVVRGAYRRENVPAGAFIGLAVSSGVIEGRARVILSLEDADVEDGDILVTAFTDPCWTPLFVSIRGLVTEVGGLMTHGAVIAREYGLPAVVGVENATRLIKDRQRIRVNGTDGYVEIL